MIIAVRGLALSAVAEMCLPNLKVSFAARNGEKQEFDDAIKQLDWKLHTF